MPSSTVVLDISRCVGEFSDGMNCEKRLFLIDLHELLYKIHSVWCACCNLVCYLSSLYRLSELRLYYIDKIRAASLSVPVDDAIRVDLNRIQKTRNASIQQKFCRFVNLF
jgi:hypothetical protein